MSSANSTSHREMAFTTRGIAYDHQVPLNTRRGVLINVRALKTGPRGMISAQDVVPSVVPTEEELDDLEHSDKDLGRVLWVGMWVPGVDDALDANFNKDVPPYRGRRSREPIAQVTEPLTVPYTTGAFRVGVSTGGERVKHYALANPEGNICEGRSVNRDEVFVFPEYRDEDDTLETKNLRVAAWKETIKFLVKGGGPASEASKAQSRPSIDKQSKSTLLLARDSLEKEILLKEQRVEDGIDSIADAKFTTESIERLRVIMSQMDQALEQE